MEKGRRHNAAQMACSKGAAKKAIPQRQRIAGVAAVVEEELARTKALEPLYKSAEPDTGPRDIVDQEILKLTRASVFESNRKTS